MSIIKNIGGHLLDWASAIANVPAALTALGGLKGEKGKIVQISEVDESGVATAFEAVEKPSGSADSGENVKLDTTLTQSGKAADAKAVGDKFAEITGISLIEPAWGDIPKIFFGAPLQQTKDEIICEFWYYSKTLKFHGWAKIKAQGNSTMIWPKKNQSVKLFADAECTEKLKINFKGWGKQNKFVIKAYWRDLTHTRDVGSVRLEAQCAKTRSDYEEMPELLRTSPNMGAVDGFPVLVYANSIYQGRYMWNIPKDKWTYNMDDELDEHCMLCSENYSSGCFRAAASIAGGDWTDEIHDTVPAIIKTRWNEVISFVMTATDEEFAANLGNYINVNSLIDRHLVGLYSCDFDGYGKNQGYVTYDGKLWYAVPYDKDGTWGNFWSGNSMLPSNYGREQYEDFVNGEGNLLFIRLEQMFWQKLQERWAVLRDTVLSVANTVATMRELSDITPPYIVAEDYAPTTAGGAFTGIPNKDTCTIQQVQKFAAERHAWMDEYIAGLRYAPATSISLSASELTIDNKAPVTLTATVEPEDTTDTVLWESTNTAVATVEGGVVTPVANGNTTIRAIAGNVSAECAVTVAYAVYPCTGISLDKTELTFNDRISQTIVATVTPDNTTDTITWESSASGIATVKNGVVTAVDNGSAIITARCGEFSAECAVTVSGLVYNPLSGVELYTGQTYDENTGALVLRSGDNCTGKFTAQTGLHTVSTTGNSIAIYIWDADDNYLGYVTGMGEKIAYVNFVEGQKYAVKFASSEANPNISDITVAIKDNSATAADTATFRLNDLAWNFEQTTTAEVNLTDVIKDTSIADFYQLTNMLVEKASHFMVLGQKVNSGSSQPGVMFNIFNFGSIVYMRGGCSGVALAGYLADNPVDLVINGE